MRNLILCIAVCCSVLACAPNTQTEITPQKESAKPTRQSQSSAHLEQKAKELFSYQEGVWDSRWDWIDKDGDLLGSMEGVETFTTILDGSVQEILNEVPAMGANTKAVMTYNHQEGKIIFFSMGAKGDYWLMKQDPVTGTMLSEPHIDVDGKTQRIRFTTLRKTANEMDIIMESSADDGKTWVKLFTQYLKRRT